MKNYDIMIVNCVVLKPFFDFRVKSNFHGMILLRILRRNGAVKPLPSFMIIGDYC